MKKVNYYDTLIIGDDGQLLLSRHDCVNTIAYNNEGYNYAVCYRMNGNGLMEIAEDFLYEKDFEELYYMAGDVDNVKCVDYYYPMYGDDIIPFVKADWNNHEHYIRVRSEHGINESFYDFSADTEVVEGECYIANNHINEDYPNTKLKLFFRFVADDGREFYIKETTPFFLDECDYYFEQISKEEFEEYDN